MDFVKLSLLLKSIYVVKFLFIKIFFREEFSLDKVI